MQLNQQQFKYQIHPTEGVSRTIMDSTLSKSADKPGVPFLLHPSGPVYEHVHDPEIVKDKPRRGILKRLGDLNMRMWGQ